jgi:hypothetical protein
MLIFVLHGIPFSPGPLASGWVDTRMYAVDAEDLDYAAKAGAAQMPEVPLLSTCTLFAALRRLLRFHAGVFSPLLCSWRVRVAILTR